MEKINNTNANERGKGFSIIRENLRAKNITKDKKNSCHMINVAN